MEGVFCIVYEGDCMIHQRAFMCSETGQFCFFFYWAYGGAILALDARHDFTSHVRQTYLDT